MKSAFFLLPAAASAAFVVEPFSVREKYPELASGGLLPQQNVVPEKFLNITASTSMSEFIARLSVTVSEFAGLFIPDRPAKILSVPPTIRSTAIRTKTRYGPIVVPPANGTWPKSLVPNMDPTGVSFFNNFAQLPSDASWLSVRTGMVMEDGTPANLNEGIYLHHLVMMDYKKNASAMSLCVTAPESKPDLPFSVFAGGGNDMSDAFQFTTQDGKLNSGYYVDDEGKMMVFGEAVNYSNVTKNIFAEVEVEYVPGRPAGMIDGQAATISATGCGGDTGFYAPHNDTSIAFNYTSKDFVLPEDGYIFQQRGHLHDGGVSVTSLINGKVACISNATYGGKYGTQYENGEDVWETIIDVSDCWNPVEFKKGDVLNLVGFYDPGRHPLRMNDMGMVGEEMAFMSWRYVQKPDNAGLNYTWPMI